MYLTERLAQFIADAHYDALPQAVRDQAKERILDTLGAALAGSCNWDHAQQLKTAARVLGTGRWTVIGDREAVYSAPHAAMIDAIFAHAVELDDGHKNAGCHAGAVVVPAALAMGRELCSTGAEVITAVAVGYEVAYRVAVHMSPRQIDRGFHPSSNCGALGAMAAVGKLMGLSADALANGLGQTAMLCSGTMEATRSGQRAKCVQVGQAAYNGILAACLARSGMEGCLSALEGKDGIFATQAGEIGDVETLCRDLGQVWSIGDTYNKLYPSCRHAQPGIEGVLDLAQEHDIQPQQVEEIWIGTHQVAYDLTGLIQAPRDSGEAKFSLAYGAAVALRDHSFGVGHLTPQQYTDPEILALARRVHCAVDPEVQALYPKRRGARVKIVLRDGRSFDKELYDLKGSPNAPVGWPELRAKFIANASAVLPRDQVALLLERLVALETLDGIEGVMSLLG